MNSVNVEEIMQNIRSTIKTQGLNSSQLGYVTPYFKGFIEGLKKRKEIVIMGMGDNGKRLYDICMDIPQLTVVSLCDNNRTLQEADFCGIQIMNPIDAVKKYPEALYVITSQVAVVTITSQLLELGVNADNIEFFNIARTGLV